MNAPDSANPTPIVNTRLHTKEIAMPEKYFGDPPRIQEIVLPEMLRFSEEVTLANIKNYKKVKRAVPGKFFP